MFLFRLIFFFVVLHRSQTMFVDAVNKDCHNATQNDLFLPNHELQPVWDEYLADVVDAIRDECLEADNKELQSCKVDLSLAIYNTDLDRSCRDLGGAVWKCDYMPQCARGRHSFRISPLFLCASNICDNAGVSSLIPHSNLLEPFFESGNSCGAIYRCKQG